MELWGIKKWSGVSSSFEVWQISFPKKRKYVNLFVFQDKIKTLEIELDEERSSAELLNDRVTRSRDQVPQGEKTFEYTCK